MQLPALAWIALVAASREVSAFGEAVVMNQFGIGSLCPAPRRSLSRCFLDKLGSVALCRRYQQESLLRQLGSLFALGCKDLTEWSNCLHNLRAGEVCFEHSEFLFMSERRSSSCC